MTRTCLALAFVFALGLRAWAEEHYVPEDGSGKVESTHSEGGHGEEGHGMFPWLMFFVQVAGFGLLVYVGYRFAWPPIVKGLEDRRDKYAQAYRKVEKDTTEVEQLVRDLNARLGDIERESRARLEKAIGEANDLKVEMASEGSAQAEELAAKARREVELETTIALAEVKLEVVERAVAATRAALAKGVSPDVQRTLVDAALEEMAALKEVSIA